MIFFKCTDGKFEKWDGNALHNFGPLTIIETKQIEGLNL